mmetsp:Transcript_35774/g.66658  ORF Transcript_35774/g.66658 Transcript_35774/m.66658 type:complete len:230 (+) Transcript_35774:747-1436(+)
MPPDDATEHSQWERHASPHREHQQYCWEGESRCGAIEDGNCVQEGPNQKGWTHKAKRCDEDIPGPFLAAKLLVEVRTHEPTQESSHHVGDHSRGCDGPTLVVAPDAADDHDHDHHAGHLSSSAYGGTEKEPMLWSAEDIRMEQLPACFFLDSIQLLIWDLQISRQIRSHHPDDDQEEQRQDQQHQHKRVDDCQPVNVHVLMPMRHGGLQLQLQCLRRRDVWQWRPLHGI